MEQLRARRVELGLTQVELAARAGVSRQLVAAVEAGRNVPAVDAALRLAASLSCSVEELFGDGGARAGAEPVLGERLREGAAVRLGRVGDQLMAAELPDHGIAGDGWAKPDAVARGTGLQMLPDAAIAGVVVAGCDPALGVADAMLSGLGPRSLLAVSAPTGASLAALERGAVHAAVVHDRSDRLPLPELPVNRVHLARWQVGIGVAPSRGDSPSLESVALGDFPLVQREPGARSQRAFERALGLAGHGRPRPGPTTPGHLAAARAAAILGGAAVTTEGAAHALGLRFVPLEEHLVEVWLAWRWIAHPPVETFVELLGRPAFTRRVSQFGGYDLSGCGTVLTAPV
jgi:DNA-binding XRE family transcriptional regulator